MPFSSRGLAGWVRLSLPYAALALLRDVGLAISRHQPFMILLWILDFHWTLDWVNVGFQHPKKYLGILLILYIVSGAMPCACAMPLQPAGSDEAHRAERRAGTLLQPDRIILPTTARREVLLGALTFGLRSIFA